MPTYTFDFDLDAWIRNLEIEADNKEEALEKLNKMSFSDIVDEGYCQRFDISDIDCTSDEEEEPEDDEDEEDDDELADGGKYDENVGHIVYPRYDDEDED